MTDLKVMAQSGFGNLVKAVVDADREIMAVDGELHADEEALLLLLRGIAPEASITWLSGKRSLTSSCG